VIAEHAQTGSGALAAAPARGGGAGPTLVVGLGLTGLSCARYLARRGEPVEVADTRAEPPQLGALREALPDVPVHLGGFPERVFAAAGRLVVSPGVALDAPAIREAMAAGVPVLGDIELFARAAPGRVAGITGSNGKSSVTTLVGEMARCEGWRVAVGGNLGPPALELLDEPGMELFVLELSSFQLETTRSLRAAAAAVLNVSADHMDRHASLDAYAEAKRRIFAGDGAMVLNLDDPRVAAMREPGRRAIGFTLGAPGADAFGVRGRGGRPWLARGARCLLPVDELRVRGRHNVANALAALALGHALGFSVGAMLDALRAFTGLPHRCQLVATRGGVRWYDDSKATNVGAAVAAIGGLAEEGEIVLIAGGDGKGADFGALAEAVACHVRAVVLLGRDAGRIEAALGGAVPVARAASMVEAVDAAARWARPGDSVLLAPACASWDMFTDYAARGRAFSEAVLGERHA